MSPHKPTPAELDCLEMVARGLTTKQIAEHKATTVETIRTQIQNALLRLDTHTRAGAVAICMREGWLV